MGVEKASFATRAFTLGTPTLTAAGTVTGSTFTDFTGCKSIAFSGTFTYGSSGGTVTAYIQTSLDMGSSWVDIASLQFTNSSATKTGNLSALTPVTTLYTPTDGSLTANSCKDGIIGDRFRLKTIVGAGYTGSTLSVYAVAKG